ncbi:uncharacterized protein EI90DRAFT_3035441 [Cantharellus anzutake]|uniref:uncharacterized protein n=1 Tax=Cantharellus anzutake TaxID=1750568 RepID=UPI001905D837|nr:uncharacterized protein EI90DRAFT_3035441 [Cantharellus anzutake]KAF8340403.1 hypothetical protein EI90DRAFT_3035441 [Cantharellus anzutake]
MKKTIKDWTTQMRSRAGRDRAEGQMLDLSYLIWPSGGAAVAAPIAGSSGAEEFPTPSGPHLGQPASARTVSHVHEDGESSIVQSMFSSPPALSMGPQSTKGVAPLISHADRFDDGSIPVPPPPQTTLGNLERRPSFLPGLWDLPYVPVSVPERPLSPMRVNMQFCDGITINPFLIEATVPGSLDHVGGDQAPTQQLDPPIFPLN